MWSYFEDLVARNSIVQSKFNFNSQFGVHNFFFVFALVCMHDDIINFVFTSHANIQSTKIVNCQINWAENGPTEILWVMDMNLIASSDA